MELRQKILTTAKEAKIITSNELCNKQTFQTNLDSREQLYSECLLEFATDTYRELEQNSELDLHEYNPDKLDLCIMAAIYTYIQIVEPTIPQELFAKVQMTTTDVIRVLKMNDTYQPSPQEIKNISERMNKLAATRLTISVTDKRKHKNGKEIIFNTSANLLSCIHQTIESTGEMIADQWLFYDIPILFRYSALKGLNRLRTLEKEYFPVLQHKTEDYLVLNDYVALRVKEIVEGHMDNPYITYEYERGGKSHGLLADCGIYKKDYSSAASWSKKKRKVHQAVIGLLDEYKKARLIKDYEVVISHRTTKGVKIIGFKKTG